MRHVTEQEMLFSEIALVMTLRMSNFKTLVRASMPPPQEEGGEGVEVINFQER
jgi:hypothetical protein